MKVKNLRSNFIGVKATDTELELAVAIQEKLGEKTLSDAVRKSIVFYAKHLKVAPTKDEDCTQAKIKLIANGVRDKTRKVAV